jgi:hypothetical protein
MTRESPRRDDVGAVSGDALVRDQPGWFVSELLAHVLTRCVHSYIR